MVPSVTISPAHQVCALVWPHQCDAIYLRAVKPVYATGLRPIPALANAR